MHSNDAMDVDHDAMNIPPIVLQLPRLAGVHMSAQVHAPPPLVPRSDTQNAAAPHNAHATDAQIAAANAAQQTRIMINTADTIDNMSESLQQLIQSGTTDDEVHLFAKQADDARDKVAQLSVPKILTPQPIHTEGYAPAVGVQYKYKAGTTWSKEEIKDFHGTGVVVLNDLTAMEAHSASKKRKYPCFYRMTLSRMPGGSSRSVPSAKAKFKELVSQKNKGGYMYGALCSLHVSLQAWKARTSSTSAPQIVSHYSQMLKNKSERKNAKRARKIKEQEQSKAQLTSIIANVNAMVNAEQKASEDAESGVRAVRDFIDDSQDAAAAPSLSPRDWRQLRRQCARNGAAVASEFQRLRHRQQHTNLNLTDEALLRRLLNFCEDLE